MDRHLKPIDKQFEEADYTGILDLSGRKLRIFPSISDEACEPLEVFEADLSGNRFDRVPPPLFRCQNLTKLSLHNNSLRSVPPEICDLVNLKHLDLSRNYLQSLPPSISALQLNFLCVNNNRLVALPANIGRMKTLRSLDLSCNALTELPPTFTEMETLIHLNLHRNDIRELPYEINSIPLQYLDISANQLSRLPLTLRHLKTLFVFKCNDNPLELPPAQVCMRGLVHILKYLKDVEKYGSDPQLIAQNREDSLMKRRRERIGKKSLRPTSDASSLSSSSSEGGEKSFYDEMTNFVHSAFGDENKHWTAQFRPHDDRATRQSRMHEEYQRLYREQDLQRNKGKYRSQSPGPTSFQSSPQLGGMRYGTLPRSGKEEDGVVSHVLGPPPPATRSFSDQPRISSNPDLSMTGISREADRPTSHLNPAHQPHMHQNRHQQTAPPSVTPSYDEKKQEEPPGSPCSSRDGSITPTNEEVDQLVEEPATPKSIKDGEESVHVFTMEVTPTSSTATSTPTHEVQPHHAPAVKMVSFSAEVSEIPRNSTSPEAEDEEEDAEDIQTDAAQAEEEEQEIQDKGKEYVQALEEMVEVEASPVHREKSPLSPSSSGTDRETSSSLSPSPAPEGVDKPKGPPTKLSLSPSPAPEGVDKPPGPPTKPKHVQPQSPSHRDTTWPRRQFPQHRKKDVRSIIESARDPNFTFRRQQIHIKEELEKVQNVKIEVEALLNVELADDLGESVSDGVLLCQLVNKLHPGTIPTIHKPRPGEPLSMPKQTMNVAAFIAACRKLGVLDLCSAGDILEFKDPARVITCIQGILDTV